MVITLFPIQFELYHCVQIFFGGHCAHGCIFTHFLLRSWSCPLSSHDASFCMSPESLHSEALHLVDLPPNLGMNWHILKVKVQWLFKITYDAQTILKSPTEQNIKSPAHQSTGWLITAKETNIQQIKYKDLNYFIECENCSRCKIMIDLSNYVCGTVYPQTFLLSRSIQQLAQE